jgi:hypothetical protein
VSRPSDYTQQIADVICERLADGESLRSICKSDSMPDKATVFRWLYVNEAFRDQYARAREEQAESYVDEMVSISDEECTIITTEEGNTEVKFDSTAVARNKLRVDTRKWAAIKLLPRKYGDKLDLNHSGTMTLEQLILGEKPLAK